MIESNDIASIYTNCVDDMYTYALYLGFQEQNIVDAIQDVFINLCEKQKDLTNIANIKFYLLRSLRNRLLDIAKQEGRHVSFSPVIDVELTIAETYDHTENRLIQLEEEDEVKRKIQTMLASLSPRQQEIIYLHFIKGYNYKQVAELMDMPYGNVRKMVYKSFKLLRAKYGKYFTLLLMFSPILPWKWHFAGRRTW